MKHSTRFLSIVLAITVASVVGARVLVKSNARADRRAKVSVQPNRKIGRIDPDIYGHFAELVYHCFYGGLWAEMLESRKFEGDDGDHYGSLHSYAKKYRSHMKKEDLKDPQFAKEFYFSFGYDPGAL